MDLETYQTRIGAWMRQCFPQEVCEDRLERCFRFLEESLELVQAMGMTEEEVQRLTAYTYGRPIGEPRQEVGGVAVTLAALCDATDISLSESAVVELDRIERPETMAKIRSKQAAKPSGVRTPLPGIV